MVYFQLLPFVLLLPSTSFAANVFTVPLTSNLPPFDPSVLSVLNLDMLSKSAPNRNDVLKVVTTVKAGAGQVFNDVLIDTGSAILWVGGENPYISGPFSKDMETGFSVGYGAGGVSGEAFTDRVTIGGATVSSQIIGSANFTTGFTLVKPIDGILGLGPTGSNGGEVFGFNTTPTFMDNLVAEKVINKAVFGIFITPISTTGTPEGQGEITFGGVDESKIKGDIVWLPQNPPINFHWEFNVTSFNFGPISLESPTFGRTDTGTLGIGLPFDQFLDINTTFNGTLSFSGSALDGFIALPSNATKSLPNLNIVLGNETFSVPPERYIVPKEIYPSLNVTDDPTLVHTWLSSAGPEEYMLGQKWLESVYTAYDLDNHLIGFAHVA